MRLDLLAAAVLAALAGWPGVAQAHPGLHADSEMLAYLISSVVTAVLVVACVVGSRRRTPR
jgi:hypothetical protein